MSGTFTTLCHVYGSAPDKYVAIVREGLLGEERAELCIRIILSHLTQLAQAIRALHPTIYGR